jgi:hypothetical protein
MFDPYLEWFKIPAGRRPPTHYELLDITPQEAQDPVAVQNAAENRAERLMRHTAGPHAEDCLRLATEVDTACKTLLDPTLRAEYDASIGAAVTDVKQGRQVAAAKVSGAKRTWLLATVGAVVMVAVGGMLAALLASSGNRPEKKIHPPVSEPMASAIVPLKDIPQSDRRPPLDAKKPAAPPAVLTAIPTPPPAPPQLPREQKAEKLPVPDSEALARAEGKLKETYKKDYDYLRNIDDRLLLAAKLFQPGREDRKDPAAWYALLSEVKELAVRAGRPRLALAAVTEIDEHFAIDPLEMAVATMTDCARAPAKPGELWPLAGSGRVKDYVTLALGRSAVAVHEDDFERALQFVGLAEQVLTRARADKKTLALVAAKRTEIEQLQKEFRNQSAAREHLKESPEDPVANLAVGMHLACGGKWDEGLPLLGRGNDADLQSVAKADLQRPLDAKAQLDLGDKWWRYARLNGGRSELRVRQRAAYWYEKAESRLAEGPEKERAAERIEEVSKERLARGFRLNPGSFQGRDPENRAILLREGGGTYRSEEAVERGLAWIVAHQNQDGSWGTESFAKAARCNCPDPGRRHDVAATCFGVLPLLAAGNTHRYGKYRVAVRAGLDFLIHRQGSEGNFQPTPAFAPYENGLATIALCEAYAMTKDDLYLLGPALRAVDFLVKSQSPLGGWGYDPRSLSPDTSATVWQIWALKTALNAGVYVPKETFDPMETYLDRITDRTKIGYWYKDPAIPSGDNAPRITLLPDGILCRELLGYSPDTKELVRSARALAQLQIPEKKEPLATLTEREQAELLVKGYFERGGRRRLASELVHKEEIGIYFLMFSRLALHHFGGPEWEEWNRKSREVLIARQDKGDVFLHEHRGGSWSPVAEEWMEEGGRLMATSMATMALEVYYSTVPLTGYGPSVMND